MSNRDEEHTAQDAACAEQLIREVSAYQDAFHEWLIARQPTHRDVLLREQSAALERLYGALRESLYSLVHGWSRSRQFQELLLTRSYPEAVDTLAMSAFGAIAAALPNLRIDPSRNVRGLLLTIARYDLYDQERQIFVADARRRPEPQHALVSGDPDAAMWRVFGDSPDGVWQSDGTANVLAEPADLGGVDPEEQAVTRDELLRYWPAIAQLWRKILSDEDWQIIRLRWAVDPPTPFAEIAHHLGPGWTMEAVKMRHYRVLQRTRKHLVAREGGHAGAEEEKARGTTAS